jgi:hypothetical protein
VEDIVERLRWWSHGLTYDPAAGLMHEAAAEIERLRNGAAEGRETVTLTDEERAAILSAADLLIGSKPGATLRSLLARLHK